MTEIRLYTVLETAEITRSSPATIRKMVRDGELDAVRWGIEMRIPISALEAYIEKHPARAPAAARHPGRNGRPVGRPRKAMASMK